MNNNLLEHSRLHSGRTNVYNLCLDLFFKTFIFIAIEFTLANGALWVADGFSPRKRGN